MPLLSTHLMSKVDVMLNEQGVRLRLISRKIEEKCKEKKINRKSIRKENK